MGNLNIISDVLIVFNFVRFVLRRREKVGNVVYVQFFLETE